ncbi:hypothetical protein FHU33_4080 [Blastococcus colisei]|uniref:Uncharacterized protein n=1 Tax=Blastococcus colisei TaxID=1564162 RepID=A0A543P004_9ACTN|nr:hypothetical protein [Blastococcus colisei]TQN37429.1 hypothetical protein FHU33_4080 [Blastococcus colisei]
MAANSRIKPVERATQRTWDEWLRFMDGSEPNKNGTASLVVDQMGLQTLELNEEARERWASIVRRFLETT